MLFHHIISKGRVVRVRWFAVVAAACSLALAGGCGRIGVEIIGDPASDNPGSLGSGTRDAQTPDVEPLPGPGLQPLQPLEDSGSSSGDPMDAGSASSADGGLDDAS